MRSRALLPLLGLLLCIRAEGQILQFVSCSGVSGVASSGSVVIYDGPTQVATVPVSSGAFSWPIPSSMQDTKYHLISVGQNGADLAGSPQSFTCNGTPPTYGYPTSFTFNSPPSGSVWWEHSISASGGHTTISYGTYGAIVYPQAITPESVSTDSNSNEYEITSTITLGASGGSYIHYVRAGVNSYLINDSGSAVGSFHAMELQNPQIDNYGNCTAVLASWESSGTGTATLQSSIAVPCATTTTMRTVVFTLPATGITKVWTLVDGNLLSGTTSVSSGQPGIGQISTPSTNGFTALAFGPRSVVSPAPLAPLSPGKPPATVYTSVSPTDVRLHWTQPFDPSGVGIMQRQFSRALSGQALVYYNSDFQSDDFNDPNVSPSLTYVYSEQDRGFHGLYSPLTLIPTTTPPAGDVDPRQVGVRPTSAYWGGSGEQINTLTGNLNFSVPVLSPQGRTGWTVPLNLVYNSQNWREEGEQSPADNWAFNLGEDLGYGYGWKMQFGSLTPFWLGGYYGSVNQYLFVDSTGAEHYLNVNDPSVWYWWSTPESTYVWFDAAHNILHFRDGSQWTMGATSAANEPDYGTMYPTEIKDRNGNQIIVTYAQGTGSSWPNSSGRIVSIEDVRGAGKPSYTFAYSPADASGMQHIHSIANSIGTAENYAFTTADITLVNPFGLTGETFQNVDTLTSMSNGIPLTSAFVYDASGDMTVAELPYGGVIEWQYQSNSYPGGSGTPRAQMEVSTRLLDSAASASSAYASGGNSALTFLTYNFNYTAVGTNPVHPENCLTDVSAAAQLCWTFSTSGLNVGLLSMQQRGNTSSVWNEQDTYTWSQDANSNWYVSQTEKQLDPAASYSVTSYIQQTLDIYGNLIAGNYYDYGAAPPSTATRAYNATYRTACTASSVSKPWGSSGADCALDNLFILNLLSSASLTSGGSPVTLVANTYDSGSLSSISGNCTNPQGGAYICEHDDADYPTTATVRGNLTTAAYVDHTVNATFDMTGMVTGQNDGYGHALAVTTASASNYAVPIQITPNSSSMPAPTPTTDSELAISSTYSSFFGLTQQSAQTQSSTVNQVSFTYDSNARIATSTNANSAVTSYQYAFTGSQYTTTATTAGTSGNHWTSTQLDGLGRTVLTSAGYSTGTAPNVTSTTVSNTATAYSACGCSPLGRQSQVSQPYLSSPVFTTGTYDPLGRSLAVTSPDGASKTTYAYQGNWVSTVDAAGKWKQYQSDSFGNLLNVVEPDPSASTLVTVPPSTPSTQVQGTLVTTYTYDVLNHLLTSKMVRSGTTQMRTFTYNAKMQLTGAANPENGTVSYAYNPDGSLNTRTDAQGIVKTYSYDNYWRMTGYSYNPVGVAYTFAYDQDPLNGSFTNEWGRLAEVSWGYCSNSNANSRSYTEEYSYDAPGNVIAKVLTVQRGGNCSSRVGQATATFAYDNEGKRTITYYPSVFSITGQTSTQSYDAMGRVSGVSDSPETLPALNNGCSAWRGGVAWASAATYNPASQLSSLTRYVGATPTCTNPTFTNTIESWIYNNLNQVTEINTSTYLPNIEAQTPIKDGANYVLMQYNYSATANNGQITSASDGRLGYSVGYTYDLLKRLTQASSTAWTQNYGYDGFSNLTSKSVPAGSSELPLPGVNPVNNRFTGSSYDPKGNLLSFNSFSIAYDWENRVELATTGSFSEAYYYDENNQRVEKFNSTNDEIHFYDPNGQLLSIILWSYNGTENFSLSSNRIYFGSMLIGESVVAAQQDVPVFPDRLGTIVPGYPYGTAIGTPATNDNPDFGTYLRDGSTGLDYAVNRHFTGGMGRFLQPDRTFGSVRLRNPQSWNRYSYVLGDPINLFDPMGLCDISYSGSQTGPDALCNTVAYAADSQGWNAWTTPPSSGLSQTGAITSVNVGADSESQYAYNQNLAFWEGAIESTAADAYLRGYDTQQIEDLIRQLAGLSGGAISTDPNGPTVINGVIYGLTFSRQPQANPPLTEKQPGLGSLDPTPEPKNTCPAGQVPGDGTSFSCVPLPCPYPLVNNACKAPTQMPSPIPKLVVRYD